MGGMAKGEGKRNLERAEEQKSKNDLFREREEARY